MNEQRRHAATRIGSAIEDIRRWASVVLVVLVVVIGGYVSSVRDSVGSLKTSVARLEQSSSRTETSANAAADAAAQAKKILEDAIAQSRSGGSVDTTAVVSALASIHRIELAICGGPCPDK